MPVQIHNSEKIELLRAFFPARNEPNVAWGNLATFQTIPALRGYWPMSSVDENGDAIDLSREGRTLTNFGSMSYGVDGLVPYADHNLVDYLQRPTEAAIDITGALTLGGWFFPKNPTSDSKGLVGKWNDVTGQRSYGLRTVVSGVARGFVSVDGSTQVIVSSTALTASVWVFLVLRYVPSISLSIFKNGVETVNTTSIPASLFSNTSPLEVGAYNNGINVIDGWSSNVFLSATALSNTFITTLYHNTRALYGI